MDVTSQLLKLFNVEKQIRGLKGRLNAAERFLAEQDKQVAVIDAKKAAVDATIKQITVSQRAAEAEAARLSTRMASLKTQMETTTKSKDYTALLTEHNTIKIDKDKFETQALEAMTKVEDLKKEIAAFDAQRDERLKVRGVAVSDRDAKAAEISGRLAELSKERDTARTAIAAEPLSIFEKLLAIRGEEAMAPIEELDRRHYEFTCGSCQRTLTMDAVNALLSTGKLTRCTNCGCVLYVEKELALSMAATGKK
jgi:predicted  nucleic acid-binding Zn-ribbon protein